MSSVYINTGSIIDKLVVEEKDKNPASLRTLLYGNEQSEKTNVAQTNYLVIETLKYKPILDYIINASGLRKDPNLKRGHVVHAMLYDLLIGSRKSIIGGGKMKKALLASKNAIHTTFARLKVKAKTTDISVILPPNIRDDRNENDVIRSARVNLLKTNLEAVINQFKEEGFELVDSDIIFSGASSDTKKFAVDKDLPNNLLLFPPHTDLHKHPLVVSGELVLQAKSSAISGSILRPPPDSIVMDGMAAPGMKTSQLAESMENTGTLYAVDLNKKRLETLKILMEKHGVTNVTTLQRNFLQIVPSSPHYSQVTHILCDPTCSGSGIVDRKETLILWAKSKVDVEALAKQAPNVPPFESPEETTQLNERLETLSSFQLSTILHAFSFPAVQKIVYSTCSIHQQENEDVVQKALEISNGAFELVHILPNWKRRGVKEGFPEAEKCLRMNPEEDKTTGFFVACFQKTDIPCRPEQITDQLKKLEKKNRSKKEEESSSSEMSEDTEDIRNYLMEGKMSLYKKSDTIPLVDPTQLSRMTRKQIAAQVYINKKKRRKSQVNEKRKKLKRKSFR